MVFSRIPTQIWPILSICAKRVSENGASNEKNQTELGRQTSGYACQRTSRSRGELLRNCHTIIRAWFKNFKFVFFSWFTIWLERREFLRTWCTPTAPRWRITLARGQPTPEWEEARRTPRRPAPWKSSWKSSITSTQVHIAGRGVKLQQRTLTQAKFFQNSSKNFFYSFLKGQWILSSTALIWECKSIYILNKFTNFQSDLQDFFWETQKVLWVDLPKLQIQFLGV